MAEGDDLSAVFKKSCNIGVSATQTQKTALGNAQCNKWLKQVGIFGKKLTSTDSDIAFNKVKTKGAKELTKDEFENKFLPELAPKYKLDNKLGSDDEACAHMKEKLLKGVDVAKGTTKTSATGNVKKMTDSSQYTGSHKERFDAGGKGKGAAGRKEEANQDGYVGAYKDKGTYDKKH